jgi:hypothetical protein
MKSKKEQRKVEVRTPVGTLPFWRPEVLALGEFPVTRSTLRNGQVPMPPARDVIVLKLATPAARDALLVPGPSPAPDLFEPRLRFVFGPG